MKISRGTMIQTILVLLVLFIVAGIVLPSLLAGIDRSKQRRTMADMKAIGTALETYRKEYDRYPVHATEVEWSPERLPSSYYTGRFHDSWNNAFRYVSVDGTKYTVVSYGKDKSPGGSYWDEDIILSGGKIIQPDY